MIVLPKRLLAADEPAPVSVYNEGGKSPFLLVADHAGNLIPRALGRLGIAEGDCQRHIAWDIGIASLGRLLANALDATLIQQNYSRLVIDCNRPLEATTSIADMSENTPIPGNAGLSDCAREIRAREIFRPYHDRIEAELGRAIRYRTLEPSRQPRKRSPARPACVPFGLAPVTPYPAPVPRQSGGCRRGPWGGGAKPGSDFEDLVRLLKATGMSVECQ
jgi:N-formylglutamate amidohydrolase